MLGSLFDFIFSAPPPSKHVTAQKNTQVTPPFATAYEFSPSTQTRIQVSTAQPDLNPTAESTSTSWVGILVSFFPVSVVSYALAAIAMQASAEHMIEPASNAEHILKPANWIYYLCAVPLAVAVGIAFADIVAKIMAGATESIRFSPKRVGATIALIACASLPFLMVSRSRVAFSPNEIDVNSVLGFGSKTYTYEEIDSVRATLERPVAGWLTDSNQNFAFAIDFTDGTSWRSRWYPYQFDDFSEGQLMRYLAKKTGKSTKFVRRI